ncbi:MAG: hypothetical protein V9F46_06010 [Chitinophagaceae bacterium]
MLAPSDNDVNAALIDETKSGKVADTTGYTVAALTGWYKEWKETCRLQYENNSSSNKKIYKRKAG